MNEQTYAGHTLAEIKAAAERAEPLAYMTYKGQLLHAADPKVQEHSNPKPMYDDFDPATVLAMAARIEALEQKLATANADRTAALRLVAEVRFACGDDGKRMLDELVRYVAGLAKDAARLDSGEIMTHDWDDSGEEYQCHRRGIDLRVAIDAAMEQTKNLEGA